jgi:hypothetical protein
MLKKSSLFALIAVIWEPFQNQMPFLHVHVFVYVECIVEYLYNVSFVHIKIKQWDNFFSFFDICELISLSAKYYFKNRR